MKYIDEFRNRGLAKKIIKKLEEITPVSLINFMEVCGTHTQSFCRFGLNKLIPENIRLIAGPGCPVCVSAAGYIDSAIKLSRLEDVIILSFGDMLRIPGAKSTLEKERAKNADVRIIYSPLDALKIAKANPQKRIVFLAVGFETTAPAIALSIMLAKKEKLRNLYFYPALKLIPPAMDYLVKDKNLKLDGFLCPGHVSAVIGTQPYEFIPRKYKIGCCVSGFEPLDILEGIYLLVKQVVDNNFKVENQYMRVVTRNGNLKAQRIMGAVFKVSDADWRGFGEIPKSGLKINKDFSRFDAEKEFGLKVTARRLQPKIKCRCSDILKGLISPLDCPLFRKACNPENPQGPCMVSSEGACNAYYRYH